MKQKHIPMKLLFICLISAGLFSQCEPVDSETSSVDDQLTQTIESGLEETADSIAAVNDSGGQSLALVAPPGFLDRIGVSQTWQRLWSFMQPRKVYAAENTFGCITAIRPDSGSDLGDSGVSEVNVERTFNDCGRRFITVNGTALIQYAELSDGLPQAGTTIWRAPDITRSHSFYDGFAHTQGGFDDTITPSEGDSLNVAQKFSFVSFDQDAGTAEYNIDTNVERDWYRNGSETPRRSHHITTTLNIERNSDARTVNGTITIESETHDFTNVLTLSDVVWEVGICYPASGTITFSVTGSREGEGEITLDADDPDDISVEYTGEGEVTSSVAPSLRKRRRFVRLAGCRN